MKPMKSEQLMKSTKDILAMVKHPTPTVAYNVFGLKCIFSYSILHLSLMSFMFTYLNIVTLFEFGVYPTLMTGNYFNMALDISQNLYQASLFRLSLVITCTLFGTILDCILLIKLQSRCNAFAVIMCLLIPIVVLVDIMSDNANNVEFGEYSLCLLCIISGALVHWSQKLGYTCTAMTGNMFKMAELLYLWFNGYTERGPKLYGEAVILFAIFFWSLNGAILAVIIIEYTPESMQLVPLACCVLPNLYFAGCFHEWGWITSESNSDYISEEDIHGQKSTELSLSRTNTNNTNSNDNTNGNQLSSNLMQTIDRSDTRTSSDTDSNTNTNTNTNTNSISDIYHRLSTTGTSHITELFTTNMYTNNRRITTMSRD